jgi:hypothetical protein
VAAVSNLRVAFKEWAVICRALAEGRQALLLRKGGIAEPGGSFLPEHPRFWLYPTFVHQQEAGVVDEARPLLAQALAERPPEGLLRLSHFAEVPRVYQARDLSAARALAGLHCWSPGTVEARFHYRTPGLYILPVRVHRAARPREVHESPAYSGCRTWVELEQDLPTDGALPVLSEESFGEVLRALERLLGPGA